jgi:hypothetical protein
MEKIMSTVNAISFGSSYLIPFSQLKNSPNVRMIGAVSAKYIHKQSDIAQVKEGVVVTVDDSKDKEYEAVIAKYGVNIQKYEGKLPKNTNAENPQLSNLPKPKLTPTKSPIIIFTDKSGEKFMAREVKLETGDVCMVVANEKNPNQGTLMNKEVFSKYFLENCKKV